MTEDRSIPDSWTVTTLGEVCTKPQYGWTTKAKQSGNGVRLLRTTDISSGTIDWQKVPICSETPSPVAHYLLTENDIVISRAGSVGISHLIKHVPVPSVFASYLIRFRPHPLIDPRFVAFYLQSPEYWSRVREVSAGIALANVNASKLEIFPLSLSPLPEQHRIVAEIERQFSLLDAGVANLKRVQANLKRYRASVLQAACEGRLVPTEAALAQEEGRGYEPADVLLTRILAERRARWEAAQLAKMEAQGKLVLNGAWKAKYQEPAAPDTSGLAELPEGWVWVSVELLNPAERPCAYGVLQPGHEIANGVPFIRVGDIDSGRIDVQGLKHIDPAIAAQYPRTRLCGNEVLITLVGTIGRTAVTPESLAGANTARAVGVLPLLSGINAHWVELWFRNPVKIAEMSSKSHEVARKTLNLEDVRAATVAIPPLAEQERIVAEVERCFSVVDNLEQVVKANLKRAERLRQSILKEAFAGRLVPQDPSDEPAGVLLERIKAHREAKKPPRPNSGGPEKTRRAGNGTAKQGALGL